MTLHPDGTPIPPLPDLRFVELDAAALGLEGGRISYMEAGESKQRTILCLHGIGSNSMGWRFSLAGLSRHARVIAWNAPGYMLSDNFATAAPTPGQYVEVAVALLDALGVKGPVCLAGSSFGSMLAACMAARHPDRVARLALLGTSRGQRWKGKEERARMLAMREASIAEGPMALARTRSDNLVAAGTPEAVRAMVRNVVAATNPRAYLQAARCTDAVDVVEDFAPRIACPTLCITGDADTVNPPVVGHAVAAAIPGARFVSPLRIGHLAELEAPMQTLGLLRNHFLGDAG
ncbi:alpha/beta fold hydrolase [Falsiroseomonas oryzae]|uniref:alpha/beta fold hydrolase n=1 Tax=Falsiroseomonas oryzae TaxID=2766473 RepID=UPI0022EB0989|nr:alpha/beta fold hydrolase [Roseomonas sp. MO-31]